MCCASVVFQEQDYRYQCFVFLSFQSACESLQGEQAKIDELSDKAQDVAKDSGDGKVTSQASQLASRYQTALVNAKVRRTSAILAQAGCRLPTTRTFSPWISPWS